MSAPKASDWTSEQYQAAIGRALKAHDMPAVVGLMHGLAVVDPHTAETLLGAIELATGKRVRTPTEAMLDRLAEGGAS